MSRCISTQWILLASLKTEPNETCFKAMKVFMMGLLTWTAHKILCTFILLITGSV